MAVVGGAKVADKLGVLKALLHHVDALVVGGGMAFTFLAAQGHDIGGSLVDRDRIDDCAELLASGTPILLPTDIVALEPGAAFGCDCTGGRGAHGGRRHPRRVAGPRHRTRDRWPPTPSASPGPARCSGTDRWASSRTSASAPARPGWPPPWPPARATPSSAAATAPPRSTSSAWPRPIGFISTGGGASLELLEFGDLPGLAALRGAPNAPRPHAHGERRRRAGRRPLVSGNWKMNLDHLEAIHAARDLGLRLQPADVGAVDVSVHPPFTDIRSVQSVLEGESIPVALGAQNCAVEDAGAFTGEVSPVMLAKLHVEYVIVGHSERRALFGETDAVVAAKLQAVLRNGMTPMCCVGETVDERDVGLTQERLSAQVTAALAGGARRGGGRPW